jgi:hypothetical protein
MLVKDKKLLISTALGIIIGLLFDDLRKLIINDFLVKIVDKYIIEDEILNFFGIKIDKDKIINLVLTIILAIIVLILLEMHVY